ncbi:hypothetical protein BH20VER2_BH20VER2_08590 [soil metagenome]
MAERDKSHPFRPVRHAVCSLLLLLIAAATLPGCDRLVTPPAHQAAKDADAKAASGDFLAAINLYEKALDGSAGSADIHYSLALLYDDKMNDPLNALHHFKRYLTLAPTGRHAAEVKKFMKRDELTVVTSLSGDSVVTRAEAARLRNENLSLRKQVDERNAQLRTAALAEKAEARQKKGEKSPPPGKKQKGTPRSHVVQPGDTLYSLSRKYYDSPERWKDIRAANRKSVDSAGKLKVGQTLTIP